jgi:hypothetical protein
MRTATPILLLAVIALGCAGSPQQQEALAGAEATATKPPLPYPRLDSDLNAVLASDRPLATASERGFRVTDDRLQVTITAVADRAGEVSVWLEERGALKVASAGDQVQADVDLELLRQLDRHPAVLAVRQPSVVRDPKLH